LVKFGGNALKEKPREFDVPKQVKKKLEDSAKKKEAL